MTTFRADTPQRFMEINRDKALKAGVPLDNIYTTVGAFLGGVAVLGAQNDRTASDFLGHGRQQMERRADQKIAGRWLVRQLGDEIAR